jgi:8-oxo-dGTP diphosphatase
MTHHQVALASHALIYRSDGQLLTIKRDGNPYLRGFWSVPAGHVEAGETATEACVREVREEVGLLLAPSDLRFVLVQQKSGSDGEERVDFFFATNCTRPADVHRASTREVADICWSPPDLLPEPFAPYVAEALLRVNEGVRLSSWDM